MPIPEVSDVLLFALFFRITSADQPQEQICGQRGAAQDNHFLL
jgi:hypothetical protein